MRTAVAHRELILIAPFVGSTRMQPRCVSADGKVVAGNSVNNSHIVGWWTWTRETGAVAGPSVLGYGPFIPMAISHDGSTIVGTLQAGLSTSSQAGRWTLAGGIATIPPLDTYYSSTAVGVSGDGSIIVGGRNTDASTGAAYRWEGGVVNLLPIPPNGFGTGGGVNPQCVSDDGDTIAGYYNRVVAGVQTFPPTIWEGPTMTPTVGAMPGPSFGAIITSLSYDGKTRAGPIGGTPLQIGGGIRLSGHGKTLVARSIFAPTAPNGRFFIWEDGGSPTLYPVDALTNVLFRKPFNSASNEYTQLLKDYPIPTYTVGMGGAAGNGLVYAAEIIGAGGAGGPNNRGAVITLLR